MGTEDEQVSHATDEQILGPIHKEATVPPPHIKLDQVQVGSSQSNDIETDICKESKRGEGTGSSGKRQRTRWDELPEKCKDGESVEDENSRKRRKTRWDTADFLDNAVQETVEKIGEMIKKLPVAKKKKKKKKKKKQQPTFRTPPTYTPSFKFLKKVYVPVKQYPSYNFVGLILGPRGNTLKRMQSETGARIVLRGLGSSARGTSHAFDHDDLHVRIEADNEESLDAAVKMVAKLLTPTDDSSNEHKQAQLKELASLKDSCIEDNKCYNCGENQEGGCKCDSESHDTARDEALLKKADLFVDQLPKNIDDRHFREFFCPFGNVLESKVTRIEKDNNKKSRRCGYVKFENPSDAVDAALSLKGFKFKGMWICNVSGRLVLGSVVVRPKARVSPPPRTNPSSGFGIFIGNLPESVDNGRLKELSCPFGRIVNARVVRDGKWRSKRCGVVEFEDHEDAAMALSHLNGFELEGKVLTVEKTRDQASSSGIGSGSAFVASGQNRVGSSTGHGVRFPGDLDHLGSQLFDFGVPEIGPTHPPHLGPIYWPNIYQPHGR